MQFEKMIDNEGIDHNENSNTSIFCDVFKFSCFVNKNLIYEDYAYNECHNLLMMAFLLDNIAVLNVGNVFYSCILMSIRKDESLKRLNNDNNLDTRGIV